MKRLIIEASALLLVVVALAACGESVSDRARNDDTRAAADAADKENWKQGGTLDRLSDLEARVKVLEERR